MKKIEKFFVVLSIVAALTLSGMSWAEDMGYGNSVNNSGIAETNLTYSFHSPDSPFTGGQANGSSQGEYNGYDQHEVNARANSFVNLGGEANADNEHPDNQQNSWSRAEINSSATRESGHVSLSASGQAEEGSWALLNKGDKAFAEGENTFYISYSAYPAQAACPSHDVVSGQGTVLGWTTVRHLENGMASETYGEGQVGINGYGATRVQGTGEITAQSSKGEPGGNYAGAVTNASFDINQQNPRAPIFGHAQGQTSNFLQNTEHGVYGQSTVQSQAQTGTKPTN